MTRLTREMIEEIEEELEIMEYRLRRAIGMDLRSLALKSVGLEADADVSKFSAAIVPVTSGLGVTPGFATSVANILARMGMEAIVTNATDVAGFAEGVRMGSDMVFMADDNIFMAHPVGTWEVIDNAACTALGFVQALEEAAGGLDGKEVVVIGLGRVGSFAVAELLARGARPIGVDIEPTALMRARERFGIPCWGDLGRVMPTADLVVHACPAPVKGELVKEGALIAAPGVPCGFDAVGYERAGLIMHDMLPTGVAVMAAQACRALMVANIANYPAEWGLAVHE
ncbi:MAG TPA: 3-methylornithyl-N6-L-lysine dehydrogenase PylD [Methanomassiliicoccales archaeon]|nr:3-methylornithyl-N6-L-lysine dehydrogenase PylD [Methanomassiliicoccales archaeon]